MIPYLTDFLRLHDGINCLEVFNGCRTIANAAKDGRVHGWERESNLCWPGTCFWAINDEGYEDGTDPWYDGSDPASLEVAGALIDPPDGDGHGFYLEPAKSTRVLQSDRFTPLEGFITFSVLSGSARGERKFIDFLYQNFCEVFGCNGSKFMMQIFREVPCLDDFEGLQADSDGLFVQETIDAQEPVRLDSLCDPDAPVLERWVGDLPVYVETEQRFIAGVEFVGLNPVLDEGTPDLCAGNRYKLDFRVWCHEWFSQPLQVRSVEGSSFDGCSRLCRPVKPDSDGAVCGPLVTGVSSPPVVEAPTLYDGYDTLGGVIGSAGRYVRKDKIRSRSVLTSPTPCSHKYAASFKAVNSTGADIHNVRFAVYEALEGCAPPDTQPGLDRYGNTEPVWEMLISTLEPYDTICVDAKGDLLVECGNGGVAGSPAGRVDGIPSKIRLDGGKRYWLVQEIGDDFRAGLDTDFRVMKRELI